MSEHQNPWDKRYAQEGYLFGVEPNAFLARCRSHLKAGQRALAVADGEGRNGVWLAEQGLSVLSIDNSAVAQEKARKLADSRGVSIDLEQVDLAHWTWPQEAFDVVVAIFIQFAPPELRAEIFRNIKGALKPGGLLLLQGYRPEQIANGTGGPPQPDHLYTEAMLREAFRDFEIVSLKSHDTSIHEGVGHEGMSALIDLVASKPSSQ